MKQILLKVPLKKSGQYSSVFTAHTSSGIRSSFLHYFFNCFYWFLPLKRTSKSNILCSVLFYLIYLEGYFKRWGENLKTPHQNCLLPHMRTLHLSLFKKTKPIKISLFIQALVYVWYPWNHKTRTCDSWFPQSGGKQGLVLQAPGPGQWNPQVSFPWIPGSQNCTCLPNNLSQH